MANEAWVLVAIKISTDKRKPRDVENDFASYIMPEMLKSAPAAVKRMDWIRCDTVRDSNGFVINE